MARQVVDVRSGVDHFQAGALEVPGLSLFFLDSRSPALLQCAERTSAARQPRSMAFAQSRVSGGCGLSEGFHSSANVASGYRVGDIAIAPIESHY